jgi:hypothetical protein
LSEAARSSNGGDLLRVHAGEQQRRPRQGRSDAPAVVGQASAIDFDPSHGCGPLNLDLVRERLESASSVAPRASPIVRVAKRSLAVMVLWPATAPARLAAVVGDRNIGSAVVAVQAVSQIERLAFEGYEGPQRAG